MPSADTLMKVGEEKILPYPPDQLIQLVSVLAAGQFGHSGARRRSQKRGKSGNEIFDVTSGKTRDRLVNNQVR